MLGKVFAVICVFSFIWSIFDGSTANLAPAILDGPGKAVSVTLALVGTMSLWSGVMEVLREAGAIGKLSKLLKPLTKILFPTASRTKKGLDAAVACISANLLGIGNAATPLAITALREMQFNEKTNDLSPSATDDSLMLTALCTASFSIVPTNVLALRKAADALVMFEIIPKIWICGLVGSVTAVIFSKICQKVFR